MLIALITILILGGSSSGLLDYIADTQDEVKVVMEKDNQRKEAIATLKSMKNMASDYNKQVSRQSKDLNSVLGSYDATEVDIDTIWNRYFAVRESFNRDMLDLRFQLKDQMTRDEWQQVFANE